MSRGKGRFAAPPAGDGQPSLIPPHTRAAHVLWTQYGRMLPFSSPHSPPAPALICRRNSNISFLSLSSYLSLSPPEPLISPKAHWETDSSKCECFYLCSAGGRQGGGGVGLVELAAFHRHLLEKDKDVQK